MELLFWAFVCIAIILGTYAIVSWLQPPAPKRDQNTPPNQASNLSRAEIEAALAAMRGDSDPTQTTKNVRFSQPYLVPEALQHEGTASTAQYEAVYRIYGPETLPNLDEDVAHLILSCRDYARRVADIMYSERTPVLQDQRTTIDFMRQTPELAAYVAQWSKRRFQRGSYNTPRLRRNEHFHTVHNFIGRA